MLDPIQEELYAGWCKEAAASGGVPPRAAFDPIDFPRTLPTLVLYELVENDAVCLRLVGTEIARAWGTDHTGHCLHEFMEGDYHDFIRGQIDQCVEQRVPIFSHSCFQWDRGRALDTRRLLLPYARNDDIDKVGFVLLSQVFDYGKAGTSFPSVSIDSGFEFIELNRQTMTPTTE